MKTIFFKRILCLLLAMITIVSMAVPAFAASNSLKDTSKEKIPNQSSISIRGYGYKTSGTIKSFTDARLKERGTAWIDLRTDECWIQKISDSGKALFIKFPVGGGKYRTAWFSAKEFLGVESIGGKLPVYTVSKMTAYKRSNGGGAYGNTGNGDKVYVLNTNNKYVTVLYPLSSSGYKIGNIKLTTFQKNATPVGKQAPVAEGIYTIASALNNKKVIDISNGSNSNGANVQLYSKNNSQAQRFRLIYNQAGYYTIQNVQSGKVLDVSGGAAGNGVNVWQYEVNGSKAQRWYLESAGSGCYYIRSALGGYLDVCNAGTKDGTNIQVWEGNKSDAQKYQFIDKDGTSDKTTKTWDSKIGKTVASIKRSGSYTKWYNSKGNISAQGGFYGQCTWYAYGRFYEVNGIQLGTARNANLWLEDNSDNDKVQVIYGASHVAGKSIAVRTSGTYGHVIFVEYVTYGTNGYPAYVYFTECNADNNGKYNAGKDCVLQKLSYSKFVSQKNPAGYILPT